MANRSTLALVSWLLAACGNAPDVIPLGTFESPCEGAQDCESGLCLSVDGRGSCTASCDFGCRAGEDAYVCVSGICAPRIGGPCRNETRRCGPSFDGCCGGLACVEWPDWGARCTQVDCTPSRCWSGCCVPAGDTRVCAPPIYCQ
ncbi:MAG: hypothetical protein KF729_05425 [Sandaracinaceae bacterium]|nr:hypothetical protein [Sandaracinaceae bacterium]